ncbi:MAG: alpha/beta hydrolase [Deltaproteobacteria bacterium]|nr:alpha/beta hydrolase [Deltaproteobacteria bacterium]
MKTYKVTGGKGIQLHVEETGNPKGKPVLFIHGYAQSRLCWKKQMNSKLGEDFRLVALDIRGHGLSEKPKAAYTDSKLWADDINAVINTLELEQPVLAGWSYGGAIICDYLRFYGENKISGINFVGAVSKLGKPVMEFMGESFLALIPGFCSNDVEKSSLALQKLMELVVFKELPFDEMFFMLGYNLLVPPYVRQGLFSRNLDNDDILSRLRKPVLLTHGKEDLIVLPEMSKHHAEIISNTQLSIYPNTGHATFWENPERYNSELHAFVSSI